jgi:hypothetical protein
MGLSVIGIGVNPGGTAASPVIPDMCLKLSNPASTRRVAAPN